MKYLSLGYDRPDELVSEGPDDLLEANQKWTGLRGFTIGIGQSFQCYTVAAGSAKPASFLKSSPANGFARLEYKKAGA